MVGLILIFIFLTPRSVFKDSPSSRPLHPNEIVVRSDGSNAFVYDISVSTVPPAGSDVRVALKHTLEPIAGNLEITRYDELRDGSGKLTAYRVWAHR